MKRSFISLTSILCLLCIILCGCSDSQAPEGYQNAASSNEAFYLYVPQAWTLNNTGGTASAYYSNADTSNVSMTCMIIEPGTMDNLDQYYDITISQLKEVLPDFKTFISTELLESENSDTTSTNSDTTAETTAESTTESPDAVGEVLTTYQIDGRETILFEYECTLGGQTYNYMQVVTMKGDFFYVFTYCALKENYAKHINDVKEIISFISFK